MSMLTRFLIPTTLVYAAAKMYNAIMMSANDNRILTILKIIHADFTANHKYHLFMRC